MLGLCSDTVPAFWFRTITRYEMRHFEAMKTYVKKTVTHSSGHNILKIMLVSEIDT